MIVLHISRHKQLDIHVSSYSLPCFSFHGPCYSIIFEGGGVFNKATEVNLMHLSMGGAMVNWKVFEDLQVGLETQEERY